MANQEQLDILKHGVEIWNQWRKAHPDIRPDLSGSSLTSTNLSAADLKGVKLSGAFLDSAICTSTDFSGADLHGADLRRSYLTTAILKRANLTKAILYRAEFLGANLTEANLQGANLHQADLIATNLSGADLSGANLDGARLVGANLTQANLTGCKIYGISAWNVELKGAIQKSLIITDTDEPEITVDNLKIAQFIYLLLNNEEIREVIDTITSKVVLILGRFTLKRKVVLDALRDELRKHNYLPVVFDFDKPSSRNLTETISILAHMSRFIIADLTSAKSIPQELERIVPRLRVPIQPLLHTSEEKPYGMFESFEDYPWVLPLYHYPNKTMLLKSLQGKVINPAEQKAQEYEKQ